MFNRCCLTKHHLFGQCNANACVFDRRCLTKHYLFGQYGLKLHKRCFRRFGTDKNDMDMCRSQISRINTTVAGVLRYVASHDVSTNETTTTPAIMSRLSRMADRREWIRRKSPRDFYGITNASIRESDFQLNAYVRCLSAKVQKLTECVPAITGRCASSDLRVVKVVRGEMRNVEALMRASRNFRLVHVIRDPRGVINSRRKKTFFRSVGARKNNMISEARYYCEDVVRDIELRRRLEAKYPGRTMQVIYDDFVKNAHERTREIYAFLETSMPPEVESFIETTRPGTASSWRKQLDSDFVQQVDRVCSRLYAMLSDSANTFDVVQT